MTIALKGILSWFFQGRPLTLGLFGLLMMMGVHFHHANQETDMFLGKPIVSWAGSHARGESSPSAVKSSSSVSQKMTVPVVKEKTSNRLTKEKKAFLKSDGEIDLLNLSSEDFRVLQFLVSHRKDLQKREKELVTRSDRLKAFEKLLQDKIAQLSNLQNQLKGQMKTLENRYQKETQDLARMYEGMKPQEAAQIFLTLDIQIALRLIRQMKSAKASAIMTSLPPEQAAQLTVALAQSTSVIKPTREGEG